MENEETEKFLKDLPVQAENIAFDSEEMIRCEKCERANPPNRLNCLYCGAELDISEERSQNLNLNLRKLEFWEKGFNVIFISTSPTFDDARTTEIAKLLKLEKEFARKIFKGENHLPLARIESEREAEILQGKLGEYGIETRLVSDETLAIEKSPRRLRGVEFFDGKLVLILFNQDEIVEIAAEDLALIVTGAIFERKIEAVEKRNKKGENKILETNEVSSDEILMDIYIRADSNGYRIWAKGFDFSSLEAEKGILAKDNFKKLADKLRQIAPDVRLVDGYTQNRELLAEVWEVEQKSDSLGLKRESFGKFNLGNVTTVNNLSQFTKYSRLQRHLL